jgi:hypothetical protein
VKVHTRVIADHWTTSSHHMVRGSSAIPPTSISGTLELSFQSPLHRSITVLVHYQSCVHTLPCVGHTTRSVFNPKKSYSLVYREGQTALTANDHKQGCNPLLHAIPDSSWLVGVSLNLRITSCRAMAWRRHLHKASRTGSRSCIQFTRCYSGYPRWFPFLCQLVCLSLAGHSAHHQVSSTSFHMVASH